VIRKISYLVLLLLQVTVFAQDEIVPERKGIPAMALVIGTDTFPMFNLDEVDVVTNFIFSSPRQYERWTAIKYHVKKVYPYAIIASVKLKEYDRVLSAIRDERLKKKYLNLCEKELRAQFEGQLRDLSITQGRILMKLIHRECGKTTYKIVKELRGSFEAAMWQAIARLFGNNMKVEYDPKEEDLMIEKAVALVEKGYF
jgi:hypothetical protein